MLVGVDIGTQSLKAVVADDRLRVCGEASGGYAVDHPRPGWAQQDPAVWEAALAPAIAGALERAGATAADVAAVAIAGQLDGCVAVDAGGEPLGPCLIWMDRRAHAELPALDPARFRDMTGQVADASHMAAKIRWLKRRALGLDGARFHQPVSYMVERLTGQAVLDHALASTTMLYSLAERDWSAELLAAFDVDRAELPRIDDAVAVAGRISERGAALCGLPAGTPVAVGTGDDFATPLGAGILSPGPVACVIGTAEVVGAVSDRAVIDRGGLVETHAYVAGRAFIENPGWLSGGAMAWLRGVVSADDFDALDAEAAAVPPGSDGLLFLPALSGAMAPEWIASARGCFYGLTPSHGRGHLARAVMEGCAFAMQDVVVRLRELGLATDSIRLCGGGARSRTWAQIRADLSGLPVEIAAHADACPVGAAMLAAVAHGAAPDIDAAAVHVGGVREVVTPEARDAAAMQDAHARYRALFAALTPLFSASDGVM